MTTTQSDAAANAATPQAQQGIRRTDLQRHDLSTPGREVIQSRVDIDPGMEAPRHRHAGEEIVHVIEGTLEYQVEGQLPVTVKAGGVVFIPAVTAHTVKNQCSGKAAELGTSYTPKGTPLTTLAE